MTELTAYEKQLIRLWKDGLSGSQIAAEVNKTRNAVMGKLMRLRQKGYLDYKSQEKRFARIQDEVIVRERRRLQHDQNLLKERMKKLREEAIKYIEEKEKSKPKGVGFFNLTHRTCKYAFNEGRFDELIFCGKEPHGHGIYCLDHKKLCYIPSRKRGEKKDVNYPTGQ